MVLTLITSAFVSYCASLHLAHFILTVYVVLFNEANDFKTFFMYCVLKITVFLCDIINNLILA